MSKLKNLAPLRKNAVNKAFFCICIFKFHFLRFARMRQACLWRKRNQGKARTSSQLLHSAGKALGPLSSSSSFRLSYRYSHPWYTAVPIGRHELRMWFQQHPLVTVPFRSLHSRCSRVHGLDKTPCIAPHSRSRRSGETTWLFFILFLRF